MIILIGVGFLAGLITGISPCIVPVLPVIVAAGATSTDRRRPYAVVAGLVISFTIFTLVGTEVLQQLHLPLDFLYHAGLVLLIVLGVGLVLPRFVGEWLEKPFARIRIGFQPSSSSGVLLGAGLGLVFVPCAGPVLTAISTVASSHRVGLSVVFITLAYSIGAGVPLLVLALVSRTATGTFQAIKSHLPTVRKISGVLVLGAAVAIWVGSFDGLQRDLPGYTSTLQAKIESPVQSRLNALEGSGNKKLGTAAPSVGAAIGDYGLAPNFTGITAWLNTPGDKPLTLQELRGKVVLVDFWTYSCINCQRTLPHVEAWYNDYHSKGFVVVGVSTPEFAFEHVVSNVASAAKKLGVDYPIAVDDNYATWYAYHNNAWPAEYLIDQHGKVLHEEFGEGDYSGTETAIRALLEAGGATNLPRATDVPNRTPTSNLSPETYVGYTNLEGYGETFIADPSLVVNKSTRYQLPSQVPLGTLAFGGTWSVNSEEATAGDRAQLGLGFVASDVYLVLGGTGTVQISVDGRHVSSVDVSGVPGLYTMVASPNEETGMLDLSFSPGVEAYDFTFG